jgi:hypothetical protein
MLTKLHYTVPSNLIQEAILSVTNPEFCVTINRPIDRFFYDTWEIKEEYKDTAWEKILSTLPFKFGEARVISLKAGECYQCHSDIDDRYHLNLSGSESFLIDIDNQEMFETTCDGYWYEMDASLRHSAANFGQISRIQLVVRKLLNSNELGNPVSVKITPIRLDQNDARFFFDQTISVWLNHANKNNLITAFNYSPAFVSFTVEKIAIDDLKNILYPEFELHII